MFVNGGRLSFVSVYALMQVPTRISHISCITQVSFKFVYYTFLVDNGGLGFKKFILLVTNSSNIFIKLLNNTFGIIFSTK